MSAFKLIYKQIESIVNSTFFSGIKSFRAISDNQQIFEKPVRN